MLTRLLIAAAALAVSGSAVAQPTAAGPADFARFDAQATPDWASKLALCDATRFLRTRPDLDADKVLVRRRDNRLDLLLPPHFIDGAYWYDEDLERASRRLRQQGQVSYDAVRTARSTLGRDMVRTFDRINGGERAFLDAQNRYCDTVEEAGRA